ncbi:MAG: tol-pal system-associated acyl-CoA thioesterase [Geminicoccaceae bacterium]
MSGGEFCLPVRVYYEDTDAAGIVYYANYLKFAERGRTEMLRAAGYDHRSLREEHDLVFAVRRCSADYRKPARLDDLLEVRTRLSSSGGARFSMEQLICRDGELLVRVDVELAVLSASLRPRRLPPELAEALASA